MTAKRRKEEVLGQTIIFHRLLHILCIVFLIYLDKNDKLGKEPTSEGIPREMITK